MVDLEPGSGRMSMKASKPKRSGGRRLRSPAPWVLIAGCIGLGSPSLGAAQTPDSQCPPRSYTVEMAEEWLVRTAEREPVHGQVPISGIMGGRLLGTSCPVLIEMRDPNEVAAHFIEFAAESGNPVILRGVLWGTVAAIRVHSARLGLEVPLASLVSVLETRRSPVIQGTALGTLRSLLDFPEVHAYLLEQGRAEVGPPGYPDLPAAVFARVYGSLDLDDPFRLALESDVSAIRHPAARCLMERTLEERANPPTSPFDQRRCPEWREGGGEAPPGAGRPPASS